MKKIFMVLSVVILFFGLVGCPKDSSTSKFTSGSNITSTPVATGGDTDPAGNFNTAPEPATLLLLGTGLVGLAGVGRKKFFKKDKDE